jgi:lipoprotein-anchoring transpeptidase ErfK/SrfK
MYYFMRIYGGVGMHQGYLPGYPASHGCIRLPGHMAEKFYHQVTVGTPVEVVP